MRDPDSDCPPLPPEARRAARWAYGLAVLSAALAVGLSLLQRFGVTPAALRPVGIVLPVIPLIGFVVNVLRMVRALDELQRQIHLEAMMLQFGFMAIAVMGYGMLARAGLAPNVTVAQAYPVLWMVQFLSWSVGLFIVRRRYR